MKQLKLRFASKDEPEFQKWVRSNPTNEFDESILDYPTLQIFCSYDEKPVAYLPIQRAVILESTAIQPGLDVCISAQALRDMVKGAELMASAGGLREIYYLGTDKRLDEVAASHGFQELPWKIYRMRVK